MFGPLCTGIMLFLALWGTVFMAIVGALFYNQSVGLFEDLPSEAKGMEEKDWFKDRIPAINQLYQQNAYNCWIACGVYIVLAAVLGLRACCLAKR